MDTKQKEKKVCKRLKERRAEMEITQYELAKKSGLERKTVNRIEQGHYSPSLSSLFMLCTAMKISPSEILDGI
jgi:DNA-binding XRE family transcriptional regulator